MFIPECCQCTGISLLEQAPESVYKPHSHTSLLLSNINLSTVVNSLLFSLNQKSKSPLKD